MKHLYLTITLLFTGILAFAQMPAGYYSSATGTGYALKTQLKNIIDADSDGLSNEHLSQDNGYAGLYNTYLQSDRDYYYENNGTLLDMYSENPDGADAYEYTYGVNQDNGSGGTSEGEKYNREHIIPQSVFNSNYPMKSDAHFVVPSDKYVNAQRGSYPFGKVDIENYTSSNGSKRGNNLNSGYSSGYSGTVFEPIDEFKGDIARMFFYFATRYEDNVAGYSFDMFNNTSDMVFDQTFLNILYTWHIQDPVSIREIDRNNAIYNAQNNRNPFIDNPQYVLQIWQSTLSIDTSEDSFITKIYPNPVKNRLYIDLSQSESTLIEIYSVLGNKIISKTIDHSDYVNTSQLSNGIYIIKITQNNRVISKKLIKN